MLTNELFQWAAIVLLGFVVLGLLRQLGFYMAVEERRTPDGPRVGHDLPLSAIPAEARNRISALWRDDDVSLLVAILVLDGSERTQAVVDVIRPMKHRLPCVAVARGLTADSREVGAWQGVFDYVVADPSGERTQLLKIDSPPFLLLTDRQYSLRYKVPSPRVEKSVRGWLETDSESTTAAPFDDLAKDSPAPAAEDSPIASIVGEPPREPSPVDV